MGQLDRIGRATFHHIAPLNDVRVTPRAIRWLKHIERHGPQSSVYLYELTRDTHRCRDTALREMQKLRAGGFLSLPPQQLRTDRAECNPYIYDLTQRAERWLRDQGHAEPTVRPTGHWWHGYAVSCVTGSIDIGAKRMGIRYIAAHDILARKEATLAIPLGRDRLIPDQLFALDYGGGYRAFLLEVDRSTEPVEARGKRRSIATMLSSYQTAFRSNAGATHYGLRCSLGLMVVCETSARAKAVQQIAARLGSPVAGHLVVGHVPAESYRGMPDLLSGNWVRGTGEVFELGSATVGMTST